jgi:hypothetical protein
MQQISAELIRRISEAVRVQGYGMRSGSQSTIYYLISDKLSIFGSETYGLIFEENGWRVTSISAGASEVKRIELEDTIKGVMNREGMGDGSNEGA